MFLGLKKQKYLTFCEAINPNHLRADIGNIIIQQTLCTIRTPSATCLDVLVYFYLHVFFIRKSGFALSGSLNVKSVILLILFLIIIPPWFHFNEKSFLYKYKKQESKEMISITAFIIPSHLMLHILSYKNRFFIYQNNQGNKWSKRFIPLMSFNNEHNELSINTSSSYFPLQILLR